MTFLTGITATSSPEVVQVFITSVILANQGAERQEAARSQMNLNKVQKRAVSICLVTEFKCCDGSFPPIENQCERTLRTDGN